MNLGEMAAASSSSAPSAKQQINQYLKKHKYKWKEEKRPVGNTMRASKETNNRARALGLPMRRGRITIDHLPDEILSKIFSYFGAHGLLLAARVCKRWNSLANDNLLWVRIFQQYAPRSDRQGCPSGPEVPPASFWKSRCIESCRKKRNVKAFHQLKKSHPYTGLPKDTCKVLEQCGVRWLLVLRDSRGEEQEMMSRGNFPFTMASLVRWYSLQNLALRELRKIQVYSLNPLFFERGKAVPNSPYQRSLLLEVDVRWDSWVKTNAPAASDDLINLYTLPRGLMLATWKGDGELAFIAVCLHHDQLVERCLYGSPLSSHVPTKPKPVPDDVDKTYGLHDYSCTVELHHQRQSIWSQQFRQLHCKPENLAGGYAVLQLIRPGHVSDHSIIQEKLDLPWKTDAFKGRLENVTLLDVTVLDEQKVPFWCVSSPVRLITSGEGLSFDYTSEGSCYIKHVEPKGKVVMELNWELYDPSYKDVKHYMREGRYARYSPKSPDRDQYFVTCLQVCISLQAINNHFSTSYR